MFEGRPKSFESVEELEKRITHYFNSITRTEPATTTIVTGYKDEAQEKPIFETIPVLDNNNEQVYNTVYFESPSILKMCKHLGINKSTLCNYEKDNVFFDTIKKAKEEVEAYLEKQLERKDQVTGIIFNLKNNFGWKDKQEVESTNININKDVNSMTAEEIKAELAEIEKKLHPE